MSFCLVVVGITVYHYKDPVIKTVYPKLVKKDKNATASASGKGLPPPTLPPPTLPPPTLPIPTSSSPPFPNNNSNSGMVTAAEKSVTISSPTQVKFHSQAANSGNDTQV